MASNTFMVKTIERVEHKGTSQFANPHYTVYFTDGTSAITEVDGQIGYKIQNSDLHNVPVTVEFKPSGRIRDVKRVPDAS